MAAIFIVCLPADDGRMGAKPIGDKAGDARRLAAIAHMRKAVMPAGSEGAKLPVAVGGQHVRHAVDQPFWRGRGRGAKYHLDVVAVQQVETVLHPVQLCDAGFRLGHPPGKFPDANKIDAQRTHLCGICQPVGRVPMFRKIADTELAAGHCVHPGNQSRWAFSRSSVIARIWRTSSSAAVCGSNIAA